MKKRLFAVFLIAVLFASLSGTALADPLSLKPVADPWEIPENLIPDGGTYYVYSENNYIVAWETPECDVKGVYMLLDNGTELVVANRISYMDGVPWGSVSIALEPDEEGQMQYFNGWVLMSDLVDWEGKPAYVAPVEIPDHPMVTEADPNKVPDTVTTPEPTSQVGVVTDPEQTATPQPEATPSPVPQRPEEAITVGNTYNSAIVYTSAAIAVIALALVAYVLLKHKALNKKGE